MGPIPGDTGRGTQVTSDVDRSQSRWEHPVDDLEIERLNRLLIETMPGVFYLYDERGRFLRWNRNFEVVSGYSRPEIEQMSPPLEIRGKY